jgi:hypothetical protein
MKCRAAGARRPCFSRIKLVTNSASRKRTPQSENRIFEQTITLIAICWQQALKYLAGEPPTLAVRDCSRRRTSSPSRRGDSRVASATAETTIHSALEY